MSSRSSLIPVRPLAFVQGGNEQRQAVACSGRQRLAVIGSGRQRPGVPAEPGTHTEHTSHVYIYISYILYICKPAHRVSRPRGTGSVGDSVGEGRRMRQRCARTQTCMLRSTLVTPALTATPASWITSPAASPTMCTPRILSVSASTISCRHRYSVSLTVSGLGGRV